MAKQISLQQVVDCKNQTSSILQNVFSIENPDNLTQDLIKADSLQKDCLAVFENAKELNKSTNFNSHLDKALDVTIQRITIENGIIQEVIRLGANKLNEEVANAISARSVVNSMVRVKEDNAWSSYKKFIENPVPESSVLSFILPVAGLLLIFAVLRRRRNKDALQPKIVDKK